MHSASEADSARAAPARRRRDGIDLDGNGRRRPRQLHLDLERVEYTQPDNPSTAAGRPTVRRVKDQRCVGRAMSSWRRLLARLSSAPEDDEREEPRRPVYCRECGQRAGTVPQSSAVTVVEPDECPYCSAW